MTLGEVVAATGARLVFEATYTLPANPFAFAAHVAVVEVDRGTGDIRLVRYAAVHDCGPMINPMIVRGQIQGGIAQGLGQAFSEAMVYDADAQPLTASLMTYGLPTSESMPSFILENQETPSPTNPLGIKGIGELPTVASPVAAANGRGRAGASGRACCHRHAAASGEGLAGARGGLVSRRVLDSAISYHRGQTWATSA